MSNELTESKIMNALEWAYEKSVNGVAGLDSAEDLANDYLSKSANIEDAINSLIRWQNAKAGTSGFLTGLGGVVTMPVAVPANIASVLYMQVRMVAAIAIMTGHDVKDDKVKTLVFICLAYNSLGDALKDAGIVLGTKIANKAIQKYITGEMTKAINKKVGFTLVTKAGKTGIVNFTKLVPFLGGIIGGSFDVIATNTIGNTARNTFLELANQNVY